MYQERSVSLLGEDLEEEQVDLGELVDLEEEQVEELVDLGELVDLEEQQVDLGELVDLEEPLVQVDMADQGVLEEEAAVEVDMEVMVVAEVVEPELEDLLITERMTLSKMRRIFKSVQQKKNISLNPEHTMKPLVYPKIMNPS